jgi:hypothetical protein
MATPMYAHRCTLGVQSDTNKTRSSLAPVDSFVVDVDNLGGDAVRLAVLGAGARALLG